MNDRAFEPAAQVCSRCVESILKTIETDERCRHRLSELPDQFVLNQSQRPPFATWVSTPVGAYVLHTHPDTEVRRFANPTESWVVGGILAGEDEPVAPGSCPSGQYVVITASKVFCDVGSLMQAFFNPSTKTVASSLRLLTGPGDKAVSPELLHGSRPDWYWAPATTFPAINYLLPTQLLDLETFIPKFRQPPPASPLPRGETAQALTNALCESFLHLGATGRPILLAMTGGMDSRTLLAAALKSGVQFETYTMVSRHVHHMDVEIAKKISDRYGIRHSVLAMGKLDVEELDWYLWFSGGQSVTLDADFHAAGLWKRFGPDANYVRGLCFALGRDKYREFISENDAKLIRADPVRIWKKFTRPWVRHLHHYNRKAFDAYASWLAETLDCSDMDFRDRLFLEQGMGGWDASAEYGLAATGTRRFSIANSTRVFELLLQERPGSKKAGPLQREMMEAIDPKLFEYPFIKPTRTERLRYRAVDTLRALRLRQRLRRLR
jgi:hypothetical protein